MGDTPKNDAHAEPRRPNTFRAFSLHDRVERRVRDDHGPNAVLHATLSAAYGQANDTPTVNLMRSHAPGEKDTEPTYEVYIETRNEGGGHPIVPTPVKRLVEHDDAVIRDVVECSDDHLIVSLRAVETRVDPIEVPYADLPDDVAYPSTTSGEAVVAYRCHGCRRSVLPDDFRNIEKEPGEEVPSCPRCGTRVDWDKEPPGGWEDDEDDADTVEELLSKGEDDPRTEDAADDPHAGFPFDDMLTGRIPDRPPHDAVREWVEDHRHDFFDGAVVTDEGVDELTDSIVGALGRTTVIDEDHEDAPAEIPPRHRPKVNTLSTVGIDGDGNPSLHAIADDFEATAEAERTHGTDLKSFDAWEAAAKRLRAEADEYGAVLRYDDDEDPGFDPDETVSSPGFVSLTIEDPDTGETAKHSLGTGDRIGVDVGGKTVVVDPHGVSIAPHDAEDVEEVVDRALPSNWHVERRGGYSAWDMERVDFRVMNSAYANHADDPNFSPESDGPDDLPDVFKPTGEREKREFERLDAFSDVADALEFAFGMSEHGVVPVGAFVDRFDDDTLKDMTKADVFDYDPTSDTVAPAGYDATAGEDVPIFAEARDEDVADEVRCAMLTHEDDTDDGAPIGDVIDTALDGIPNTEAVLWELHRLIVTGDAYAPSIGTVRLLADDGIDGATDADVEEAVESADEPGGTYYFGIENDPEDVYVPDATMAELAAVLDHFIHRADVPPNHSTLSILPAVRDRIKFFDDAGMVPKSRVAGEVDAVYQSLKGTADNWGEDQGADYYEAARRVKNLRDKYTDVGVDEC